MTPVSFHSPPVAPLANPGHAVSATTEFKPEWQKFSQAVVHGTWSMDSPLSAESVQDLADWLASSPAELRCLNLTEKLPAGSMPVLFKVLKDNTTLNHLNLCDNPMDVSSTTALSEMLEVNQSLWTLTIRSCGIDNAMMERLSKALCINAGLVSLTLSGDSFGDDGLIALSKALTANKTLVVLNINQSIAGESGPCFTDPGVEALAGALESNKSLVNVRVDSVEISKRTWAKLLTALSINASIQGLLLCDRNLSEQDRQLVETLLAKNATLAETEDLRSDARSGLLKMAAERYPDEVMDMVFTALIKMPSIPIDDVTETLRSLATFGKVPAADAAGAPCKQGRI